MILITKFVFIRFVDPTLGDLKGNTDLEITFIQTVDRDRHFCLFSVSGSWMLFFSWILTEMRNELNQTKCFRIRSNALPSIIPNVG